MFDKLMKFDNSIYLLIDDWEWHVKPNLPHREYLTS